MKNKTKISLTISLIAAIAAITTAYIQSSNTSQTINSSSTYIDESKKIENDNLETSGEKSPILKNTSGNITINYD